MEGKASVGYGITHTLEETARPQKSRASGKKPETLFAAVKVKMVMRIYGVSRAKALEIIARREDEKKAAEGKGADRSTAEGRDGEFMSAEEFFGA